MLTVNRHSGSSNQWPNIDIQDRLIIRHIEFAEGTVHKVYVKFSDEPAGLKAMRPSYVGRQNSWLPIEKCETEISVKKRSALLKALNFL